MKCDLIELNEIEILRREIELDLEFMLNDISRKSSYIKYDIHEFTYNVFFEFKFFSDDAVIEKITLSFPSVNSIKNVVTIAMIEFLNRYNTFTDTDYEQFYSTFIELV